MDRKMAHRHAWFFEGRLPRDESGGKTLFPFIVKLIPRDDLTRLISDPEVNSLTGPSISTQRIEWKQLPLRSPYRRAVAGIEDLEVPTSVNLDLSGSLE